MKKLPGSLEIKLHERLSKNDILNVLAEQMTILEENFDIQEFKLFSFLECYIDGKKQALYINDSNGIVSSFTSNTQHNIENTSKTVIKDGGKRIVSYDKSFDADKIAKTIHEIQAFNTYKYSFNNVTVMPASIINSIIQQEENKRREEEDRLYLISQLKRKQEEEKKAKEHEEYERPLKLFISNKIKESGLSEMDFKRTISSSCDYLFSVSTKAKYFAEKPELFEKYRDDRLIRYSIKRQDGKVGKVEIYTEDGKLIFEQYKTLKLV